MPFNKTEIDLKALVAFSSFNMIVFFQL